MILDVPRFKCFVKSEFLTNDEVRGKYIEAYCFSVTLIESRALLWTVHTADGAIYSRLPTYAICHAIPPGKNKFPSDVFGAISSNGQVIAHAYLKDYMVHVKHEGLLAKGVYAFTIDYFDGGFAEDPEQHKTSNVIFLDSGYIYVGPNNHMRFVDTHFTGDAKTYYRRNKKYFYLEDFK